MQDALGLAVAQEMQKVYKKDLEPPRVPKTVHVHGFPVEQEDVSGSRHTAYLVLYCRFIYVVLASHILQ